MRRQLPRSSSLTHKLLSAPLLFPPLHPLLPQCRSWRLSPRASLLCPPKIERRRWGAAPGRSAACWSPWGCCRRPPAWPLSSPELGGISRAAAAGSAARQVRRSAAAACPRWNRNPLLLSALLFLLPNVCACANVWGCPGEGRGDTTDGADVVKQCMRAQHNAAAALRRSMGGRRGATGPALEPSAPLCLQPNTSAQLSSKMRSASSTSPSLTLSGGRKRIVSRAPAARV